MRSRYLDVLRSVAIFRVVAYHATGWWLLSVVFPAMGTMFAIAGSLIASSLDRGGVRTVLSRARRLLPPLWTIAAILVPAMVWTGMSVDFRLLYWLVPLQDPPVHGWGNLALGVVWYLRQYLWFVLLSPLALPLFRRYPVPMLALPAFVLIVVELHPSPSGPVRDFGIYFGCWLLGFAHHDGMLARLSKRALVWTSIALGAFGLCWMLLNPGSRGFDLNFIPVAQATWSAAFVLVLLGLAPADLPWLNRSPTASWLVTAMNRRAVTVYLWHQSVIVAVGALIGLAGLQLSSPLGQAATFCWIVVGVVLCTMAFGWVEDLAARRPPKLAPAPVPRWRLPVTNLSVANLRVANLRVANLRVANLRVAHARVGLLVALLGAVTAVASLPISGHAAPLSPIAISNSGPVGSDDNTVAIAINPTDSQNLVAAWNDGDSGSCRSGYSGDGGQNWRVGAPMRATTAPPGDHSVDSRTSDPSVGFLDDGTAVLSCDLWDAGSERPWAIVTTRSSDGGRTWKDPQWLTGMGGPTSWRLQDHHVLTIDQYRSQVLIAYSVWDGRRTRPYAMTSLDGGHVFQGPYEIASDYRGNATGRLDVTLAASQDGTIYAALRAPSAENDHNEQTIVVSQLQPGERRFTRSVAVRNLAPVPRNPSRSTVQTAMRASIAVEPGGTVDLLMSDVAAGGLDLFLARSFDHGYTFATSQNLTNDSNDQFSPRLAVSASGRVDLAYYDLDRSTDRLDAGYGQIPPGAVGLSRMTIQADIGGEAPLPASLGPAAFFGDTTAIAIASSDAMVAVVWTGGESAARDVFAAVLRP